MIDNDCPFTPEQIEKIKKLLSRLSIGNHMAMILDSSKSFQDAEEELFSLLLQHTSEEIDTLKNHLGNTRNGIKNLEAFRREVVRSRAAEKYKNKDVNSSRNKPNNDPNEYPTTTKSGDLSHSWLSSGFESNRRRH